MKSQVHSLLKKQLVRVASSNASDPLSKLVELVNTVYEDNDRDRLRSERSMTLMIDELSEARTLIDATFENLQQGVMMIDANGKVRLFNKKVCLLLSIPHEVLAARPDFQSLDIPAGRELEASHSREIEMPDGKLIEVLESPLRSGGFVHTYVDITRRRKNESAILQAQAEFRALFENAVVGIYRSDLKGRPERVNPALARLHGFNSPDEFLAALNGHGFELMHADASQRADFVKKVSADGRVTDLTWEIQRLKTGEPIWVTETAWTVAGQDGAPAYIEGTVVDATAQRIAQGRAAYLAHHDPLTGLANRVVFNSELKHRLDPAFDGHPIALHCIDLDRFKIVNDTMGHVCGDALLQMVSNRLRTVTHGLGLAARLGGDEFAFVQTGPVTRGSALECAEKLRKALNEPYMIEGKYVPAGATIGVALAPEHATIAEDLFKKADMALCEGKTKSRGSVHMFDPAVAEQVISRQLLETELKLAWSERQFHVVFQPIIDVSTGTPFSYEALLRWDRPGRLPAPPSVFIPLAEELGLISEIGAFVLMEACRKVSNFDDRLSISVNASPIQFQNRSIIKAVQNALAATGLSANRLIVEVTETLLMLNDSATRECMDTLSKMGVRLALDDFGIGFSALSYLAQFQFNEVKIDKAFVAQIEDGSVNAAIIHAILNIGKSLNMAVVAEGVETCAQAERLRSMGCVNFQGYLYGKPSKDLLNMPPMHQSLCA